MLAGGSVFGLAAADGVATALYAAGRGWPVGPDEHERVPIVPAAILFDLGRGGAWLHHPGPADGVAALGPPRAGRFAQGAVGAGTGARTGGLRGGVGTASAVLPSGATVGALVVVNASGAPFGGRRAAATRPTSAVGEDLPAPDAARVAAYLAGRAAEAEALRAGTATTLAVVATDATLTKAGCQKLAGVAHDGFARALSPVHTAYDGDTVFALATGARPAVTGSTRSSCRAPPPTAWRSRHRAGPARGDLRRPQRRRRGALPSYRDALTT